MKALLEKSLYLLMILLFNAFLSNAQSMTSNTSFVKTDTVINNSDERVNYKPTRLYAGLQSPLSLGFDGEFRIVKNLMNLGIGFQYHFPKEDYIKNSQSGLIFLSLYAPINRLTGNYDAQDKGLFVFANAGYGGSSAQFDGSYLGTGESKTVTNFDFTWRVGLDYFIFKGFGLTVIAQEFKTYQGGIVASF